MEEITKKVVGYIRVSTDDQADGASLANQRRAIEKYARCNNMEIVEWFEDPGVSAKTAHRPGLQKLLDYCKKNKGKIDHIVVYNTSRTSRNINSYFVDIAQKLISFGVTVRSTIENVDETPAGKLMLSMSLIIHQFDNDVKSQTSHDNMAYVLRQGWWITQPPLGLIIEKVPIDELDKSGKQKQRCILASDSRDNIGDNIAALLNRFSAGDITEAELHRLAESKGIRAKNGKLISFNTLDRILRMPIYAGYYASDKLTNGELIKMKFNGIISLETFNRNQMILNGDKRDFVYSPADKYPLKGCLICERCGKMIRGSAPKNGSGKASPRYHCCVTGHHSISVLEMHNAFDEFLRSIMPADSTIKLFKTIVKRTSAKKLAETNKELKQLEQRKTEVSEKINQALEALLDGRISQEEKESLISSLQDKRNKLSYRARELEKIQRINETTIEYVCNFVKQPAKLWRDADYESRQAFQRMLFPNGLHFDIGERKFGTEDLSPLFSVICNKKESDSDSNSHLVISAGVEPALSG